MIEEVKTNLPEATFSVQRIYVKSSLFESAMLTSDLLTTIVTPVIDMQAQLNVAARSNDMHEAVLTLQVTAKLEGSLLWRMQLQQAGLYKLEGFQEEGIKRVLNGYCMNQLYPYAAASISAMAVQGGFPPVYLAPMNFEALYLEKEKREQEGTEKQIASEVVH